MIIHKERLLKLASHLDSGKLGHKEFDITVFNTPEKRREPQDSVCGYAGCAVGECPIVFPDDWEFKGNSCGLIGYDERALDSGMEYFDLTTKEFGHLFVNGHQNVKEFGGTNLTTNATKEEVSNNIKEFVKIKYGEDNV